MCCLKKRITSLEGWVGRRIDSIADCKLNIDLFTKACY